MTEKRLLVHKELIEAAVERIFLNQGIILPEKIPHRALLKPQTMQPPLAARIDEPIADQRLQNMPPTGPFARIRKPRRPEPIQLQLFVEIARQPARSPLPRPMQLHRLKPHLHAISFGMLGQVAVGREQSKLPVSLIVCVQCLDYTPPIRVLAVIDFAEIPHRPLHHLAASTALALHNAPVTVVFSVLNPSCESQIHDDGF
jgi:hypothetical protein